jgi:hypothetical protein
MTALEVARIALERGRVESSGKTPGATLAAQLYVHVRDHPHGPLRKIAEPGASRARRESVQMGMARVAGRTDTTVRSCRRPRPLIVESGVAGAAAAAPRFVTL